MFGFDLISGIFGYVLGFLFEYTNNYGMSVILFTLGVNILAFPIAVSRYKNTSTNVRLEAKKYDLKKRCGQDVQRYNRELMELYQSENVNPMKGCMNLSLLFTILIFGGIYSTIQSPLTSVLHLDKNKIPQAVSILSLEQKRKKGSDQLDVIRSFNEIREKLTMFSDEELEKISKLNSGFNFMGLNLLNIPKFSKFTDMMWILPVLSFLFSALGTYVMQKISGMSSEIKGFGKCTIYFFSAFQAWIVYTVFAALGLYLITNGITAIIQSLIVDRFFSPQYITAKKERRKFNELIS